MIAYIYDKYNLRIETKISNVVSVNDNKIIGDTSSVFGTGANYIILQVDTIELNIGDTIDITELEDCRDYFLKGKDYWYLEQINKANILIKDNINDILNGMMATTELYEIILDTTA